MAAPEEVRHRATYFLGKLGPEARSAIPALLRLVSDSDARVRSEVAFALGRIGDSSIVVRAALTQMQADSSRDVQFAAAISLWSFDPTDLICIQQVEDLLSPSYLSWPSICLKNIGGGAKIFAPALLRAIESTPWSYSRMQAVDALWVTKGDKALILDELESLAKALASPGSTNKFSGWTDVEDSIGYAVIYLNGDKEFRDRLKPLLQSILRNPSSQAHKMAAFYLRKFSELDHRDIANAQPESHPAE